MRHHRDDVVRRALVVLDDYGLADLTMRRLAAELGVQPGALYHHVASKQVLLGLVADTVLTRGGADAAPPSSWHWDERVVLVCARLREAVLAYRDGAEVVATARAFGLGAAAPDRVLLEVLADAGLPAELVATAARTLVHFVLGHATDEQTHLQADGVGALPDPGGPRPASESDFRAGLALVLDGIRARVEIAPPRG